jgi:hypothetical protein
MASSDLDLDWLRHFVSVVETGNFSLGSILVSDRNRRNLRIIHLVTSWQT